MRLRLQVQRRGALLLPASVRGSPLYLWPQYDGVWRKPGKFVSPTMCSWAARCCNERLWTYRDHRCDMRPGDENMERHLPVRDTSYKTRRHRCTPSSSSTKHAAFSSSLPCHYPLDSRSQCELCDCNRGRTENDIVCGPTAIQAYVSIPQHTCRAKEKLNCCIRTRTEPAPWQVAPFHTNTKHPSF